MDLLQHILDNNDESEVRGEIDEVIPEYLDDDWEDEFDDQYEAYMEQGRGEAESQVLNQLIRTAAEEQNLILSLDEHCRIFDGLKDAWNISTE